MDLFGRILWWGSRVIGLTTSAVSIIGIWNNALQTQALLGLTWQKFAILLFVITAIGIYIDLEIRRNRLEKSRPRITVKPFVTENKRLILEVLNDGFGGDFSAKARIRSGSPITDSLDLQWEANGQVRYHIDGGGGEATLLVAVQPKLHKFDATDQKSPTLFHSGKLELLTVKGGQTFALRLCDWELDATSSQMPRYQCVVEITITSEPTLLKSFKRRPYKIEMDGLNLAFTEMPIPHKKGSQS